jgi:hypothetical protein
VKPLLAASAWCRGMAIVSLAVAVVEQLRVSQKQAEYDAALRQLAEIDPVYYQRFRMEEFCLAGGCITT